VNNKVLAAEGPEFAKTLNAVSALLTTDVIVALNKEVQINHKNPADIAKLFLQANHLA
jgi:glycine betaine/choline ABC-type transport system substrate-binding protein